MNKRILVLCVAVALAVVVIGGAGIALAQTVTPTPTDTAWVGVSLSDLNQKLATRLNLTQTTGVVIVGFVADSPAAKAGLKVADIVASVDDKAVATSKEAVTAVQAKKAGNTIAFGISRGGQSQTINVTASAAPTPTVGFRGGRGMMPGFGGFGLGHGFNLGGLPNMKDLQSLNPAERFGQFLGQTFRYLDKDGKAASAETVLGTVVEAKAEGLTIKPNEPGKGNVTYTVNKDTKVMLPGAATVDRLKTGDPVTVTTSDGKTALSVQGSFGFPTQQPGNMRQKMENWGTRFPGRGGNPAPAAPSGSSS